MQDISADAEIQKAYFKESLINYWKLITFKKNFENFFSKKLISNFFLFV